MPKPSIATHLTYLQRIFKSFRSDDAEGAAAADEKDIEIDGFDFAKLRQLHPNLTTELSEFRNYLIDSTNEMQPMKVWQLQDLSFQVIFCAIALKI